jgi:tRNA U54 and U55 pseudouridine synthase Pus10
MSDGVVSPTQCLIDRDSLKRIDDNVKELVSTVQDIRVDTAARLSILETQVADNKEDIKDAKGDIKTISWRVGTIMTGLLSALYGILKFVGGGNG